METETSIKELAFVVPRDIEYEKDLTDLSNDQLIRWHDMMHVFFKKLEDGLGEFKDFENWNFNKVIFKHHEIVNEMARRGINHYAPINHLDKIKSNIILAPTILPEHKELSKKDDIKLDFDAPNQIEKQDNQSLD